MNAIRTKAFRNGDRLAVEIPKTLWLEEGDEVTVEQNGGRLTIKPLDPRKPMAALAKALRELPPLTEPWVREPIEWPERPGL